VKHSLAEHWNDVSMWWHDVRRHDYYSNEQDKQVIFFTAYERWLNDRELLTVEDGYQWKSTPVPEGAKRYGSIT